MHKSWLLVLAIVLSFSSCKETYPTVCHPKSCVSVEVVSSLSDMERGLMGRKGLAADQGMLFVFKAEDSHAFWMKNMLFSIDILWIDSYGKIVDIEPETPPCRQDPCPVYAPQQKALYVLELSSGYVNDHDWKIGDTLRLEGIYAHHH